MAIDNVLDRPKAREAKDDKSVGAYLDFLDKDVKRGRGALGRFRKAVVRRWWHRVDDVKIDRENDRIDGDVGL